MLPERQRETGPRILPAPQRLAVKLRLDDLPRSLAQLAERRRRLPPWPERGRARIAAPEPFEDLVVELHDPAVLPKSFGIVGRRSSQMFFMTEVDAQRVQHGGGE